MRGGRDDEGDECASSIALDSAIRIDLSRAQASAVVAAVVSEFQQTTAPIPPQKPPLLRDDEPTLTFTLAAGAVVA